MTAERRVGGTTDARAWGGRRLKACRRIHRLAPGVIFLCLVMIFSASLTIVASPAKAAGTGVGPNLLSGDWVGFSCPKGYISVAGTQICANGFSDDDECGSPTCSASLVASMDSGSTFGSWETAGAASVVCSTCSSTTLKTSDPNGGRYSGSVSECVAGPVSFSTSVTVESTNVTVYFEPTLPAGCSEPVYVTLTWGNTTAYQFTAISNGEYTAGVQYSTLIDYLEPGFKYDYKLVGTSSCCSQGTSTSSWTTAPESSYLSTYGIFIRGTVYDTGGATAPANVQVEVQCTANALWSVYAVTNSLGRYSIAVGQVGQPYCSYYSLGYFVVQVQNGWGVGNNQWNNHWNESVVVWAPQFVNFYLDQSPLSTKAVVSAMEFTHTARAQVSFCKDTSSSWELDSTDTQSGALFGASYSVTSGTATGGNFGSSSCETGQGEPGFEAWGYPSVAGDLVFNAVESRSFSIPWTQYYIPLSNAGSGNATGAPIQDWLSEPTTQSESCVNSYGAYMFHYTIPVNSATQTFEFYAGGSVSGVTGENFGVSIPFDLDGTQIGSGGGTWGYTLTTTLSNEFYASVVIPGPVSVAQYFTVACSPSSVSETGIVLHVWQDSGP